MPGSDPGREPGGGPGGRPGRGPRHCPHHPHRPGGFADGGDGNTCVEVAASPGILHLRESDTPGTELTTATAPLAHLIRGVKSGLFHTTA
ncbi:DUF397 domain-containing protein [Streptomyces sp. NPDC050988]|uniref:DUF397 domain-containing protein n=1 Tax=Streptomyces sp. NPDC050988 TaxID=3365637 RepID=UPI00379BD3DB